MARTTPPRRQRLVYKGELLDRTGTSYVTILKDIKTGLLAPGRVIGGRTAWLETEIVEYLDKLPRRRYAGASHNRAVVTT